MMPQTVPDGFEFEQFPGDEPGRTLHGGHAGDSPILAEQIQSKFVTVDAQLAAYEARIAALEDGTGGAGWIPIGTAASSGSTVTIDLTAGGKFPSPPLWNIVRVYARVDLNAVGSVDLRINGDNSSIYRSGGTPIDSAGNVDSADAWHFSGITSWRIAQLSTISTGNFSLTLFHTAANPGLISFQCTSGRQSDDASVHRWTGAHGSLMSGGLTPTSLVFSTGAGASSYEVMYWWAEGLRMVAPS